MSTAIDEEAKGIIFEQLLELCTDENYDIHIYEDPRQVCFLSETPSVASLITTLLELEPTKHVFIQGGVSTGHKIQIIDRPDGVFITPY